MLLRRMQMLLLCSLLSLIGSCTTVPVSIKQAIVINAIMVLPVSSLHIELQPSYARVDRAIERKITSKGFQLMPLSVEAFTQAHNTALENIGSFYDPTIKKFVPLKPDDYVKSMVDLLRKDYAFDVLMMPELKLRSAIVSGDKASWDGVTKHIEIEKSVDTPHKPLRAAKGLSLRVATFTPKGAAISRGIGGMA